MTDQPNSTAHGGSCGIITQGRCTCKPNSGNASDLAKRFHETYERLAPSMGYETREESAVPWEEVPENNKRLMIAVCAELLPSIPSKKRVSISEECAEAMFYSRAAINYLDQRINDEDPHYQELKTAMEAADE